MENEIFFSSAQIQMMVIASVICFVLPIIAAAYFVAKKKAKLSSFLIGMGFSLLTIFIVRPLVDMLFFVGLGLMDYLRADTHPVYAALYSSLVDGLIITAASILAIKFCMKGRDGKGNALMLGFGKGALECMLYGGAVNISNLVMAILINNFGLTEYFNKLGITDQAAQKEQYELLKSQIASPPGQILSDCLLQVSAMILHTSLVILIYIALKHKELLGDKTKFLIPAAAILQIIGYLPIYLIQAGVFTGNEVTVLVITLFYMIITAFFISKIYRKIQ